MGASAGLNLRFDHYRYEIDGRVSGDPDSPVRFAGMWQGPHRPDLPERFEVAERRGCDRNPIDATSRSEEHTSELQSLMRISYAVFCLKKTTNRIQTKRPN